MLFLTLEVMTAWLIVASITGLFFGALISSAEKMRHETWLEAIFARVSAEQVGR